MKDFQKIIDNSQDVIEPCLPDQEKEELPLHRQITNQILPYISPFLLSMVTGPLNTASILLQVTSKGQSSELSHQAKIKAQPHLQRHIVNGIFGDNKIYQPPKINGYRQLFKKLGREGLRGLYKGNLTGVVMASMSCTQEQEMQGSFLRTITRTYSVFFVAIEPVAIAICTLTDLITLPLMTAQSRLVLQHSSSHFRTYKSALSVWKKAPKASFSGSSIVLLKNIIFELSWIKLFPSSPSYSFMFSTLLSHILTYPFILVMRQLQTSDPKAPMMQNRSQNVRETVKRIWKEGGLKSFYRGFLAHSFVHLFMGALIIQTNLRSGYFLE